jgi:TDG/mug DNA glycosylase family protein
MPATVLTRRFAMISGMQNSLPPFVDEATRVLVVGSMPGEMSLRRQQYYAHPRNAFWSIMGELLDFDPCCDYQVRLGALRSARIGLWDVLQACERVGSLDSAIAREGLEANDFGSLFERFPNIKWVFLNGAKAERVYIRMVAPAVTEQVEYRRLPSTSPANAAVSYSTKLDEWRAVVEVGLQGGDRTGDRT